MRGLSIPCRDQAQPLPKVPGDPPTAHLLAMEQPQEHVLEAPGPSGGSRGSPAPVPCAASLGNEMSLPPPRAQDQREGKMRA